MAKPDMPEPRAGGAIIALLLLVGAIVGMMMGQTSAGLVAGLALGIAIAVGLWLADRRR